MATPRTVPRARRRQRREESRRQIVEAAEAFLRRRPYRELTVDELMAQAGFTRTLFYRHFDDLPALVVEVLEQVGAGLRGASREMAAAGGDPDRLRAGLREVVGFFAANGPVVRAVAEAASYDDRIEAVYESVLEGFVSLTERTFTELRAAGRIAELEPRATARALTALNERYLLATLGREPQARPEEVFDALWTIWRRTLFLGDAEPARPARRRRRSR